MDGIQRINEDRKAHLAYEAYSAMRRAEIHYPPLCNNSYWIVMREEAWFNFKQAFEEAQNG